MCTERTARERETNLTPTQKEGRNERKFFSKQAMKGERGSLAKAWTIQGKDLTNVRVLQFHRLTRRWCKTTSVSCEWAIHWTRFVRSKWAKL